MKYQAFLFSVIFSFVAYSQGQLYSIEDLKILQKELNYREYLEHAHDIRPSLRTESWKSNLFTMVQGYLSELISKKDYSKSSFQFSQKISQWPSVKNKELFQLKKTKYSLRYLDHCFKNRSQINQCQKELEDFWSSSVKYVERPDISVRLGTLMAPHQEKNQVWRYFKVATNSKLSIFYCKRPLVQDAVLNQVMEKVDLNQPEAAKKLWNIANSDCWSKITPQIKLLLDSPKQGQAQYAYSLLDTLGQLTQFENDIYLTRYLLQDPPVGEIFNLAWTNIKIIGQSYPRRTAVIKALKTLDPLPGKIFGSRDHKKRDVLSELLFKSIPEYFDHYSEVCYKYLSGQKNFPNGNPTIQCRELIKSPNAKKWISAPILQKFKTLPIFI